MNTAAAFWLISNRGRPGYLAPVSAASPTQAVAAGLDGVGTMTAIDRGRTLLLEGDPAAHFFKVVEGALRAVRHLPDGRRYVAEFLLPGDHIGLAANGAYSQTIEAVSEAKLVR